MEKYLLATEGKAIVNSIKVLLPVKTVTKPSFESTIGSGESLVLCYADCAAHIGVSQNSEGLVEIYKRKKWVEQVWI